jgi:hypothetical protein
MISKIPFSLLMWPKNTHFPENGFGARGFAEDPPARKLGSTTTRSSSNQPSPTSSRARPRVSARRQSVFPSICTTIPRHGCGMPRILAAR